MEPSLVEISADDAEGRPDGERCVRVRGEVDMSSAGQLAAALDELIDAGADRVVVDTSGVTFLDSTGLRVLVEAAGRLERARGKLVVEPMSPTVRRILEMTGLLDRYSA